MPKKDILVWKNLDGLRCADGSPAGYFTTPPDKWDKSRTVVIFLEGGGWAYTVDDFVRRAKKIKSNKAWYNGKMKPFGMLKTLMYYCGIYCNAVYLPNYDFTSCSGTAGKKDLVTSDGTRCTLYFDGRRTLHRIVEEVREKLEGGTVIVSGHSAGGTAVWCNVDEISDMLPGITTCGVPGSGFFLDLPTANDKTNDLWPGQMRVLSQVAECAFPEAVCAAVKEKCGDHYETYKCFFPEYFVHKMKTPMFIAQSMYDSSELKYTLAIPRYAKRNTYNAVEWEAFHKLYCQHLDAMQPLLDDAKAGAFLINTPTHSVVTNWRYKIKDCSVQKAITEWLQLVMNNFPRPNTLKFIDPPLSEGRARKTSKCCIQ